MSVFKPPTVIGSVSRHARYRQNRRHSDRPFLFLSFKSKLPRVGHGPRLFCTKRSRIMKDQQIIPIHKTCSSSMTCYLIYESCVPITKGMHKLPVSAPKILCLKPLALSLNVRVAVQSARSLYSLLQSVALKRLTSSYLCCITSLNVWFAVLKTLESYEHIITLRLSAHPGDLNCSILVRR